MRTPLHTSLSQPLATAEAARVLARRLLVGLLVATFSAVGFGLAWSAPAGASSKPPFTDAAAQGYLGLCNADGQQITSGALATRPFVATVVSSTPAVTPYNDDWRTAILMAYQVQPVLPAGAWSGQGLTASSRYTNPNHPMAAATSRDSSLRDFLVAYPAVHRGLVELRLYLGTKGQPQYATRYPTLAIKVTGDTWRAIGGGPVDCTVGKAVSIETLLLPSTTTTTGASAPTTSPQASTTSTSTVGGTTPTSTAPEGTTPRRSSLAELAIVVVLFAIVLVGVTFGLRKRSTTDDQPTKDAQ